MKSKKKDFFRIVGSRTGKICLLTLLALALFISPLVVQAAEVTLAWDANSEPDLAGYKIHYGTASGVYSHWIDVGNITQYTLTELDDGVTYYLAATAYDQDDNESGYSDELVHTTDTPNHNPAPPSVPSGSAGGYTQTNYAFDTSASDPDGDGLEFRYDWGDESISDWGASSQSHAWSSIGIFCVKARAKDSHGALSGWSDCKSITITENTHVITASAGANGSISPSGSVTVDDGANRTFTITAAADHHVQNVLVDGVSVGAVTSYTFANVTENHAIAAIFAINTYTITATDGANGSVSPSGSLAVSHGTSRTITIGADANYHVQNVLVDGVSIGAVTSYTFTNVTENHTIAASFAINTHIIAASAGEGGSISPAGSIKVNHGSDQAFTMTPSENYHIDDVLVDGDSVGAVAAYQFNNLSNSRAIRVVFAGDKHPPTADAGADQTMYVNETVQLDGSGSSDADGDRLIFHWSMVSKPSGSSATLSSTQAVKPTFDVDVAGNYTVQLIVNDGAVNSAPDTVTISTENSAPVGRAGADQTVIVNGTVQLDGSGSSDVDGDSLTFTWSFVSKPGGSDATLSNTQAVKPTFDVDAAGTYTVQLIVNDGTANSAPDTVTISTENSAPLADAGADQAVLANETVQLDGSASSDVDGDGLTFKWSFVSKPGESSATLSDTTVMKPTFDVDIAGTYTLQLIVNDGNVNSAPDTVTISTENSAPVSHAGPDQSVRVNDSALLDGSGSRDADGDTLTFNWSFISKPDGSIAALSNATAVNPTFMVDVAGSYIVQLIVNDGTDNSTPDTVTIITGNAAPWSNAGDDQTVEEGETVTLSGLKSTDPDDNIAGYTWQQTGGTSVTLSNSIGAETTFIAPNAMTDADTLIFKLTVTDTEGLQGIDYCIATVTKVTAQDSDGDAVPDEQDAFPYDADEYLDTDGDGEGNNADTDDDNDGMPDSWESQYGLDPLIDDAAGDPDGDEVSNIDEYNIGSEPNYNEGNFAPDPPQLLIPNNNEIIGLTPLLETDQFYDPNANDIHSRSEWKIIRVHDDFCVFDVTTNSSLTALKVPKLILEDDTDYSWQVKFIDNQGTASAWSEAGYFTTEFLEQDSDGNGIIDHQEVDGALDLDKDGISDREQSDIKCITADSGKVQIGIGIRDAENIDSILFLEIEEYDDVGLIPQSKGKPGFIEFGLLHFSLLLNTPGEEAVVTIYLSRAAFDEGRLYKYNPVNTEWLDYSEYAEFSSNRKKIYLTLKDGGFGDADGIENGIIVDPLAFGSETNPTSSSDDILENVAENLDPTGTCFISSAGSQWPSLRGDIPPRELSLVFILMMLVFVGKVISMRVKR